MDEYIIPKESISISPRTVSLALTNKCNLSCPYCYAPKNNHELSSGFVKDIAVTLDKLGTLELTFGGGEPLIYPGLTDLIQWIWNNTTLGINITSNGHLLTNSLANQLAGNLSSFRFSVDGIEPKYSKIKKRRLSFLIEKIKLLQGLIPYGMNIIVNPGSVQDTEDTIKFCIDYGSNDILLIPEHQQGKYFLTESDWMLMRDIMNKYQKEIQINLTYNASNYVNIDYLDTDKNDEFMFAHISADQKLKRASYSLDGIYIQDPENIAYYFSIM